MKLIKTHLIPGGVVKTYEDNRDKVAKFSVELLAESASESGALSKLAASLQEIANAVRAKADELNDQALKAEFVNRIRKTERVSGSREERRKEFLAQMAAKRAEPESTETETENPYGTETTS